MVEKFATQHNCDVGFGTLFSHVVIGSAPRAGELKLPYFVVSEGHHVASGMLNRYTLQPGITDVKSQVQAMAPFVSSNLGKKVTMIYPDFAFGHDHRDYFTEAIAAQGGEVVAQIAIPPSETSQIRFLYYLPWLRKNHIPHYLNKNSFPNSYYFQIALQHKNFLENRSSNHLHDHSLALLQQGPSPN